MLDQARIVIIGGGAVGCSALWHLARMGQSDALLLERNELTAGSTWHAAGNCPTFSTSLGVMKMQRYSAELYRRLEQEIRHAVHLQRLGLDPPRPHRGADARVRARAKLGPPPRHAGRDDERGGHRGGLPLHRDPRPRRRLLGRARRRRGPRQPHGRLRRRRPQARRPHPPPHRRHRHPPRGTTSGWSRRTRATCAARSSSTRPATTPGGWARGSSPSAPGACPCACSSTSTC